jgi:hypothetical protein
LSSTVVKEFKVSMKSEMRNLAALAWGLFLLLTQLVADGAFSAGLTTAKSGMLMTIRK